MSSILVNDVFEELTEENKRLLNELMFANKCLNVLIRFKTFIDFISDKIKNDLKSNESQNFDDLLKEIEIILEEKHDQLITESKDIIKTPPKLQSNPPKNVRKVTEKRPKRMKSSKEKTEINGQKTDTNNKKIFEPKVKRIVNRKTLRMRYVCGSQAVRSVKNSDMATPSIGCGKDFRTKTALRKHLKTHGQELYERYVCGHEGCQFRSFYAHELTEHLKIHNGVQPHECKFCGKRFSGKQNLHSHYKRSHEVLDETLICEFCNKAFKTELSFKIHRKRNHLTEKRFKCNHQNCNYKALSKSTLSYHILSHTTERRYKCSFEGCHKFFKTEIYKKSHESTHLPKQYIRCSHEGCDRMITASRMSVHLEEQHSGKTYSCDWPGCDFTTNKTKNLRNHSYIHRSAQYACDWPQCGKSFKKKLYLNRHLRIHNNDKRYACSWPGCQYRCTDDGNLNKHKRVHLKQ